MLAGMKYEPVNHMAAHGVLVGERASLFDDCRIPAAFVGAIAGARSEQDLLRAYTTFARRILRADRCSIVELLDEQTFAIHAGSGSGLRFGDSFPRERSFPGQVLATKRALYLPQMELHPDPNCRRLLDMGFKATVGAPIRAGHMDMGVLSASFRRRPADPAWMMKLLDPIASMVGSQLQLLRQLSELSQRAQRDGLTGVLNRKCFDEDLATHFAIAEPLRGSLGLVIVDLDHFKSINDTHGHRAGDAVLKEVARRLQVACRETDRLYRIGGEEFAILLDSARQERAVAVAARLLESLRQTPMDAGGAVLTVTASLGVGVAPDSGSTPCELFNACDRALYAAKKAGRNRVRIVQQGAILPQD